MHAYSGQVLNISNPAYVAAAASILTIEARHASIAGLLMKPTEKTITPDGPFDTPFTAAEVLKAVEGTGFLEVGSRSLDAAEPGLAPGSAGGHRTSHLNRPQHQPIGGTMPNVGPMEIILVLIVALIVFGPKKLPELGKSLGKGINEFKGSISGEHHERRASPLRVEPAPVKAAPVAAPPSPPWSNPRRPPRRREDAGLRKRCGA